MKMKRWLGSVVLMLFLAKSGFCEVLLLYGGENHDVFLGSVNTGQHEKTSIWNQFGEYGSPFNRKSIWNQFGPYGGQFSQTSPFNQFARHPPVIVDAKGGFYGYFTANRFRAKRTTIESMLFLVDNYDWVQDHLDEIRDTM